MVLLFIQTLFQRIVWLVTFAGTRVFSSFRIVGQDNIQNLSRPLLIIANHRSFWDPFVIGTVFPISSEYLPLGFMVADEYYKWLRPFFWLTRTYPAKKGQGMDISLKAPRRVLKTGGVFLIFPAGHRYYLGRPPRPRRGAAVLALETPQLTILPIYLKTISGWRIQDFLLKRKNITVVVGRPFKLEELTSSRNVDEVSQILADEIYKLNF
ncbi:MAG: 1-acyl-sn-glycerol-3-phosphate acyltransferase [Parcubacteria group bacterium]|nr:1-acyl-sn-glycerol-3-phosphate acyltransferase [Parcubacteria group bacterium]